MKVAGNWIYSAERERVWGCLTNPEFIRQCIPGCEKMEPTDEGIYTATLSLSVGSVKGSYVGRVVMVDKQYPQRYRLLVEGNSKVGFVKGEGWISLEEQNGCTQVDLQGEVQVGGTLASVGQRLIHTTAHLLINRFFETMRGFIENSSEKRKPSFWNRWSSKVEEEP